METVNIHYCKTNLSRLLSRVKLGEEIIISNRGTPVAKLVPFRTSSNRQASLGLDRERFIVPEDFNARKYLPSSMNDLLNAKRSRLL
jgi:prevent-host-death family protein